MKILRLTAQDDTLSASLVVEIDGEDERAGLRIVEIVLPAPDAERAFEVRLGIYARVIRPRVQVARGKPELDRRKAGELAYPRVLPRVRRGDLPQLHVAGVFDTLPGRPVEVVPQPRTVPILSDRNGLVRSGANDARTLLDRLAKHL